MEEKCNWPNEALGRAFKRFRIIKGLSIKDLSERMNVSESDIDKAENGDIETQNRLFCLLCQNLGLTAEVTNKYSFEYPDGFTEITLGIHM